MKKSTLAALVLLIIGVGCCAVACGMGVGSSIQNDLHAPRFLQYNETATDKGLDARAEIERLVLDIDGAECVVQTGSENKLTAGTDTDWKLENGTLTVKQELPHGWWWKSKAAPVTLTLRKGTLSTLDIDVDAGTVSMDDLIVMQALTCTVDAGAAYLDNVDTNRMELDVDAGEIVYSGAASGPIDLDCDAGSIELTLNDSSIGQVTGKVDLGSVDVSVDGKTAISRDGLSDTVNAKLPGTQGNDVLTFDCDAGEINVKLTTGDGSE